MDLSQSFDMVEAIRYLDLELQRLGVQVASLTPSATMDASNRVATLKGPYLGPGISQRVHEAIWQAGYTSMDKLQKASDKDLLAIKGVGRGTLRLIKGAF